MAPNLESVRTKRMPVVPKRARNPMERTAPLGSNLRPREKALFRSLMSVFQGHLYGRSCFCAANVT
jgi:hypothetical protein